MKGDVFLDGYFLPKDNIQTFTKERLKGILERFANQKVIEELERIPHLDTPLGEEVRMSSYYVYKRIKELKQEI
jgi:hypothetical protein